MFAMTRLRWLGALVIGSALAVLLALVAFSPAAQANHSWGKYHWARTSNPFTLKLADNVSSTWDSYLKTTSSDWSQSSVLDTKVIRGLRNPATCSPTSGQVEVCNAAYGQNRWLGVAQIWIGRRNHIVAGTTKVNDTYFNTAKYNTSAWRNLVMCQEVGHVFGLDHQDEDFDNPNLGSCMDYTNDPSTNQHPNQHDYDQLEAIYAHTDNTTTVSPASTSSTLPPAASRGSFNSRAQWGQLIQKSRNEQLALYERNFGGVGKLVTFVIWA
jgi:hypothetical protein